MASPEPDWADAIDMHGAPRSPSPSPTPARTGVAAAPRLLIRPVRIDVTGGQVIGDARLGRALHPNQRALPLAGAGHRVGREFGDAGGPLLVGTVAAAITLGGGLACWPRCSPASLSSPAAPLRTTAKPLHPNKSHGPTGDAAESARRPEQGHDGIREDPLSTPAG